MKLENVVVTKDDDVDDAAAVIATIPNKNSLLVLLHECVFLWQQ